MLMPIHRTSANELAFVPSISVHLKRSFIVADIELRFHKDMLVLSAPVAFALERQGIDMREDGEFVMLMEPETVQDALRMEAMTGAQCLVTNTEGICEARLAHNRMEDRARDIALHALEGAWSCKPQHLICEIGSCGLPLDPSSESSRAQSEQQYENAVQALNDASDELDLGVYDAVLLSGLRSAADAQCAISGVRNRTDRPVFAIVDLDEDGLFAGEAIDDVVGALDQADVLGFSCAADQEVLSAAVRRFAELTEKPLLVQIRVKAATAMEKKRAMLGVSIPGNPYATADSLADAALALRAAGAQFLRVVGEATPACTGALAVAVSGADSLR